MRSCHHHLHHPAYPLGRYGTKFSAFGGYVSGFSKVDRHSCIDKVYVKNVQQYLKNLGYMDVVDGQYGNKTKASAIMFQANEELAADGEIGNVSYKVMQLTTKKFTVLKKGVKSNAVKKMQTYLIKLGYLNSYADGDFGSVTEIAVKKFQKENGLYVDGIAGIQTLVTLYSK